MGLELNDDLPSDNIFEVSLIGTGGGYGESIVIHIGYKNWIVVDSCIDPETKDCLPLNFLISKGVNIETDVKLIICTHWHDDHILGISKLLEACKSSSFCMASVTDREKFLLLVGLDHSKMKSQSGASSTIEIKKCLDITAKSKQKFLLAFQDKCLFGINNENYTAEIFSLSPSDFVVEEFNSEISTLISEYGSSNRKIIIHSPNDKSVALLVVVNGHSVILGSDLEVTLGDNRKGWLCILDNCCCIKTKSSLFKIPHHGSSNGYDRRIWEELLAENPVAQLTPWNLGRKLPQMDMLKRYLGHTDELYITSLNGYSNKAKKRDPSISKAISQFNKSLCEVKYKLGVVRSRLNFLEEDAKWNTTLLGQAEKLSKETISSLKN